MSEDIDRIMELPTETLEPPTSVPDTHDNYVNRNRTSSANSSDKSEDRDDEDMIIFMEKDGEVKDQTHLETSEMLDINMAPIETMSNIPIEIYDCNNLITLQSKYNDRRKRFYSIDRYFYHSNSIDSTKLKITSITPMMSTEFKNAKFLSYNINKIYSTLVKGKDRTRRPIITDATSSIGCDTIAMALSSNFESINAVEMLDSVFSVLKNNIEVFDIKNIKLYNSSYESIYKDLKQDIVYIDAPWFSSFNNYKRYNLFIGQINVVDMSIELLEMKLAKMVVLKVPPNFNIEYLIRSMSSQRIVIDKINNSVRHIYSLIYLF